MNAMADKLYNELKKKKIDWDSLEIFISGLGDSINMYVDEETLLKQLKIRGKEENAKLPFQKALLNGELPYTIGGGIGQSRICMYFLRKAHVGEVQSSVWPEDVIEEAKANGINLL